MAEDFNHDQDAARPPEPRLFERCPVLGLTPKGYFAINKSWGGILDKTVKLWRELFLQLTNTTQLDFELRIGGRKTCIS
jgi:hypothetical protein